MYCELMPMEEKREETKALFCKVKVPYLLCHAHQHLRHVLVSTFVKDVQKYCAYVGCDII